MNREQKRRIEKKIRASGKNKEDAAVAIDLIERAISVKESGFRKTSRPIWFEEDDRAVINTDIVKASANYDKMSEPYKRFVEDNDGKVFTVHKEHENIISFKEEPKWFFWSGDLVKVEEQED